MPIPAYLCIEITVQNGVKVSSKIYLIVLVALII